MRNLRPRTMTVAAGTLAVAMLTVTGCSSNDDRPTDQEIAGLFDQWNAALASGDPGTVANLYAADGVLLPTLSPVVRSDRDQIKEYFEDDFLPKKPQGTITESHVRILDDENAAHSGNYRFSLTEKDGGKTSVEARFTYVYEKIEGRWLIVEHHSSAAPA